jgi:hypothetical protein
LAAPEIALVASFATLDAAELAAPDPHPLSAAVAAPRARTAIRKGGRTALRILTGFDLVAVYAASACVLIESNSD